MLHSNNFDITVKKEISVKLLIVWNWDASGKQ